MDTGPLNERALRLRLAKGYTRPQLAQLADITPTHIYHVETGRRHRMRPETLERYAKALDVTPQYLEYGYDPTPSEKDEKWPAVSVLLRHTSELSEDEIAQVERFVQALEIQHRMQSVAGEKKKKARVTDMTGTDLSPA